MFWDISVNFPSCFATDKATTYFKTFLFIFPHVFDKTMRQHILERVYAFSHIFLTLRTNGRRLVEPFCRFSHTFLKGENDGMFSDFSVYFPQVFWNNISTAWFSRKHTCNCIAHLYIVVQLKSQYLSEFLCTFLCFCINFPSLFLNLERNNNRNWGGKSWRRVALTKPLL